MNLEQRQNLLGMKAFLFSETFFFGALITAFIYIRYITPNWSQAQALLDWKTAGVFTLLLIASSFTLNAAVKNHEKGKNGSFLFWSAVTLGLGGAFLANQLREYSHLYQEAVAVHSSIFGSAFYTLTGIHTLHVTIGLLLLVLVFWLMATKRLVGLSSGARAIEYYWHFVDVVWIAVYTTVYLMGAAG